MTFQYCSPQSSTHSNMHMEKIKKTQIAELLLVVALLVIIAPLLSTSSLRSANLVNNIIIAVAAEDGLFFFFFCVSAGNEKPAALSVVSQQPIIIFGRVFPYCKEKMMELISTINLSWLPNLSEKCYSDKILGAVDDQVHKAPSIFFIVQAKATVLKQDMLKITTKEKKLGSHI